MSSEAYQKAREDPRSLTLVEALEVEGAIEAEFETCPECGNPFEEVALTQGGEATFVHENDGMFFDGCGVDVSDVLPEESESNGDAIQEDQ